jgi:uncharacterized membrane protein SpoIIM required for sporulation
MYKDFRGKWMNRRYKRRKRESKIKTTILTHIEKNIREYAILSIIFLIGIVIGVIFINNTSETQSNEITTYITSFVQQLKENQNIDNFTFFKDSIKKNIVLAVFLWFMGCTVIGTAIVYLTVCFRGFCLGYTISSIILSLGIRKRIDFFAFKHIFAKYFICSVHTSISSERDEITQFYYER